MSNKFKRNFALVMACMSILLYALIFINRLIFKDNPEWWMWFAPVCCFIVFLGLYRNYSQAVKEDEKFSSTK